MILTNRFDPDVRVFKEAKYLVDIDFKVEILCWDRSETDQVDDETIQGIEIKRFRVPSRAGSGFKQLPSYFKFIRMCKKYIENKDYDYLHCHDFDGAIVGILTNHKKKEMIFDMHEFYESGRLERLGKSLRLFIHYIQDKSYKIMYVDEIQKMNMKSSNLKKLVYLPNYPEYYKFESFKRIPSNKLRIVYTGYVRQYAALKSLMDAANNNPSISVTINGSGISYADLKQIEPSYSNTTMTGQYSHEDIAKIYAETDVLYCVFNVKSKNNNASLATKFFEAIITETPMIVNQGTCMAEFCSKYNIGYIVDSTKTQNIKSVIFNILEDKDNFEKKKNNLSKIKKDYTWENVVNNLAEVYR